MSLAASSQPADHTGMELEDSTVVSAAVDPASAAAAATMSDLSDHAAAAMAGQSQRGRPLPMPSKRRPRSFCAPVYCVLLWVGAPLVPAGLLPRRDSFGYQICELCSARLNRVKHHRPHGVGRACKKHSIAEKPAPATAPVTEPVPVRTHKRKAESDPGQPSSAAAAPSNLTRLRVRAPRVASPPTPPPTKKAHMIPANVSLLLDQAHARRMAAAAAAQASSSSALHDALVDEETSQMAARKPAQWARRDYLQNIAPRCQRCNFPRTGRKGWNEKTGCHTDKDCNNNRWRTIDMFC